MCDFALTRTKGHQRLLAFEGRGLKGVVEVLQMSDETFEVDGRIAPCDLEQFVAMHSWDDAVSVYRLATFVEEHRRLRREVDELRERHQAAVAVLEG